MEYEESFRGSPSLSGLIGKMIEDNRLIAISNASIKSVVFKKKTKKLFQSNRKDWPHIALVILSPRKKILSRDTKLRNDVNNFPKVDKIKPEALDPPDPSFYAR